MNIEYYVTQIFWHCTLEFSDFRWSVPSLIQENHDFNINDMYLLFTVSR